MSAIQTTEQLRDVSLILRNLIRVGIPAETMLEEAAHMLPEFREQFIQGAAQISNRGATISQALSLIFPADTMAAIVAGDQSGTMEHVMEQIWRSAKMQIEIDQMIGKLKQPFGLMIMGLFISLAFYLFLIPFMYESMSQSAPPDFDPGAMINSAVDANAFVMANLEATGIAFFAVIAGLGFVFTRRSVKEAATDRIVNLMLMIKPLGAPYAQLKFGLMAQYLQIVSMAGLEADRRIDLVVDTLPLPLQRALLAFKAEMMLKGLKVASGPNPANDDDPRHSEVLWPRYIRLAFSQANEGDWVTPMREFGAVLIDEGREKLQAYIGRLNLIAKLVVGLFIIVPVGMLYGTMGQILVMSVGSI